MADQNNNLSKAFGTLGIAMKAGKLASGEFMTLNSIRDGSAYLVLIAKDASDNTKKRFTDSCRYYDVPIFIISDKFTLGRAVGKQERASVAVLDKGFADSIKSKLADMED